MGQAFDPIAKSRSIQSGDTPMSTEDEKNDDYNEDGPGINGDLGSWLYVLGGIPSMILFFVLLFGLTGACDANNVLFPA
jgi:hypothetical protein